MLPDLLSSSSALCCSRFPASAEPLVSNISFHPYKCCLTHDTPKRRLKLSPENGNPSPEALLVAMETKTPTGRSPSSPQGLDTQRRSNSWTPTRQTTPRPMRLLDKIRMNSGGCLCQLEKENNNGHEQSGTALTTPPNRSGTKRGELAEGLQTPAQKKRKSGFHRNFEDRQAYNTRRLFCSQETDTDVFPDSDGKEVIGDTQTCLLPTVEGRHQDLRYITAQSAAALLIGDFDHLIDGYVIVDCRYPYEYEGGHIKGALNLYTEEQLVNTFFPHQQSPQPVRRRNVIIFHCEFSSQRGPNVCRSLRRIDRNVNQYPRLCFPELYILKDGYKQFFQQFETLCEPRGYVQMHSKDYKEELLSARRKARLVSGRRRQKELFKAANRR
ncbi:cell division cycle 25 homolog d isoform X1 [Hemitrygon akajei]|uniref:cell division cycle 25 homolog d isoform X1 n=2 Tax=Hemitrygon akajei TaxID=2704970 RepID=UPI003BF96D57